VSGNFFCVTITNKSLLRNPEKLEEDFPYWRRLHGYWRTLPNFNPYTVSSEPGQDLGAQALAFIQNEGAPAEGDNSVRSDSNVPALRLDVETNADLGLVCFFSFVFTFTKSI
jgi:hypothetical protein